MAVANLYNETDIIAEWEERAAIREHDGGMRRSSAEYAAAKEIRQRYGYLPDAIAAIVLAKKPVQLAIY